jgi:predicted dehydrogenase
MTEMVIGVIGCGSISDAYLKGAARSNLIRVKSVADLRADAAAAKALEYGVAAVSVDALLADPEIGLVLNLTIPAAHAPVDLRIVQAGKHAYSEKPLAVNVAEAETMLAAAKANGVRVGCAPDTFLGAGHQACRRAIDQGRIGAPVAGAITIMSHGMEHWHPNPLFYYQRGGGPVHDMGPYYLTQLINLLGPVTRVAAQASIGNPVRTVTSQPHAGMKINVDVPTTVNGVLEFASGANVSASLSWDVWKHRRPPIEIYGTEGSLLNPDPNWFGGEPMVTRGEGEWEPLDISDLPFGAPNRKTRVGLEVGDYRIIGLLDMVAAIRDGRPHRASADLALHVLEVMDAFETSSIEGRHVTIRHTCARPAAMPTGAGEDVFGG